MRESEDGVRRAADFAARAHAGQVRKGKTRLPYFEHLAAVVTTLRSHGYTDSTLLAAAYLHDVLEDQPAWADDLVGSFPPEVVHTVQVLTEQKLDAQGQKRKKEQRFQDFLRALSADSPAAVRARAISCADKLHNAESLLQAQLAGDQLLTRLATRPGQHARHHAELRGIYAPSVGASLLAAFDRVCAELEQYIMRWLPAWAIVLAAEAHLGQLDGAGAPYILHPLRMVARAAGDDERIVAALHDVVEDGHHTLQELADEGLSATQLDALDSITRRRTGDQREDYEDYLERVLLNRLAMRVKLLDLEDNLDPTRKRDLGDDDRERRSRYQRARQRVMEALGAAG